MYDMKYIVIIKFELNIVMFDVIIVVGYILLYLKCGYFLK